MTDKIVPCLWFDGRAEEAAGFYVSQIVPRVLIRHMADPDPARAKRVMEAMMQMKRIDITAIERAYQGDTADA